MIAVNINSYYGRYVQQVHFVEAPQVGDIIPFEWPKGEMKEYKIVLRKWRQGYRALDVFLEKLT
jgi:hypothetical protein